MNIRKKSVVVSLLLFAVYAALMGVYCWYTAPVKVPAEYAGTAADPAVYMTPEQLEKTESLRPWSRWFYFVVPAWQWLVLWLLLAGGAAVRWRESLERTRLPRLMRYPVFALWVWTAVSLAALPLQFARYRVSFAHGVATQSAPGWLRDWVVSFFLDYLTVLVLLGIAQRLMSRGGRWKLKLWLLSVPLIVFYMYIQPVFISPLFTEIRPMTDERLERSILELAERADIRTDRVYEAEMSSKTNAMNAQIRGIGSTLRIIVWDTTLERLSEEELLQIIAHEFGHYAMRHLEWATAGYVFWALVLIAVVGRLYERIVAKRGSRWGIRRISDMSGLPLIMLLVSLAMFISQPAANAVSRASERAADQYALELTGDPQAAVSFTRKMAASAFHDPYPPLLVRLFDTHPSDLERIVRAIRYEEEQQRA
jgi:Zn-dependent protease with chaperone function